MQNVDIIEPYDLIAIFNRINDLESRVDQQATTISQLDDRLYALENPISSSPSGVAMPTDIPSGWRLAVSNDFDDDCAEGQFASIYGPQHIGFYPGPGEVSVTATGGTQNGGTNGYKDTTGRGTYSGKFISAEGSVLRRRAFTDSNGKIWVSSIIPFMVRGTTAKWGDSPGAIWEERVRFIASGLGYKAAHLAWPITNTNLPDGELDLPEFEINAADPAATVVKGFIHHQGATVGSDQTVCTPNPPESPWEWHTYRTEWLPGQYARMYIDGVKIGEVLGAKVPNKAMHFSLQDETSLLRNSSGYIPVPAGSWLVSETDWFRAFVPENV